MILENIIQNDVMMVDMNRIHMVAINKLLEQLRDSYLLRKSISLFLDFKNKDNLLISNSKLSSTIT